jgi:CHAT domain-containing protein
LGHNPLLLAGIALTGANEREKGDGILTALEVTALDLRGTDLVVLSACDTGLGTAARGQELLGLRWAFAYAGAKNLVTSLWSVPDAETATLMTHFYTALWEKGLSVPAALRAAQLIPYVGGALDTLLAGRASEIWKRLLERSKRRSVAFTLAC